MLWKGQYLAQEQVRDMGMAGAGTAAVFGAGAREGAVWCRSREEQGQKEQKQGKWPCLVQEQGKEQYLVQEQGKWQFGAGAEKNRGSDWSRSRGRNSLVQEQRRTGAVFGARAVCGAGAGEGSGTCLAQGQGK